MLLKGDAKKSEEKLEEGGDEELDETLSERLWGLTEVFLEKILSMAGAIFDPSLCGSKNVQVFQGSLVDWNLHGPGTCRSL